MSKEAPEYDASHIQVLEGLEAVRKRPGMYIGTTSERGLRHLVFETAERSMEEILDGRASRVDVTLTSDGGVRVADDGPGIPLGRNEGTGDPGLEVLLTRLMVGVRPRRRRDEILGVGGVGLAVVNALSSRMTVEVRREGVRWGTEYSRGVVVTPLTETGPATGSGTTITFWPDAEIFTTTEFSFDGLAERFRELAFLNRELEIRLTDHPHPAESPSVRFQFSGGAQDFVGFLDAQEAAPDDLDVIGFEWEDPGMAGTAEVALRWRGSGEQRIRSFANSRPTPGGGSHEAGFRDGIAAAINAYACEQGLLPSAVLDLSSDQVGVGLTAVVSVKLDDPVFEGSTRDSLGNGPVRSGVGQAVREHLGRWLEEHPERAEAIIDGILSTRLD